MDLLLWRHAEAEPGRPGQADEQRVLTAKGHKQARKMADWLNANLPDHCRILCSPSVRTVQTAEALGRKFALAAELAPNSGVVRILSAAGWPDAREPALVIGHQPALGQIAAYVLGGAEQDWVIRKANVWWIVSRKRTSTTGGERAQLDAMPQPDTWLRAVMTPTLMRK